MPQTEINAGQPITQDAAVGNATTKNIDLDQNFKAAFPVEVLQVMQARTAVAKESLVVASPPKTSFHFNWGKALGVAILGLEVYKQTQAPGSTIATTLEDPENLAAILSGVSHIFNQGQNQ